MPPMLVVKCLGIMRKEVLVFPNTLSSKKKILIIHPPPQYFVGLKHVKLRTVLPDP